MNKYAAMLLVLSLAACQPAEPTALPAIPEGERLSVAASFSLLADVAGEIAGSAADVMVLVPRGEDPRSYSPPAGALAGADVLFTAGAGLEKPLEDLLIETKTPVVEVSAYVGILPTSAGMSMDGEMDMCPGDDMRAKACDDYYREIDALHEGRYNHTHEMGMGVLYTLDCQAKSCDPHVWGDPHNVMLWAMRIRDTLNTLDPANAEVYTQNTDAYLEELLLLIHEEIKPAVATIPESNRTLVTTYDSLAYFAKPLGFDLIQVENPASLADAAQEAHVTAIFASDAPEVPDDIAVYTLGAADGPATTYLDYMRHTTQTIVEALEGEMGS